MPNQSRDIKTDPSMKIWAKHIPGKAALQKDAIEPPRASVGREGLPVFVDKTDLD